MVQDDNILIPQNNKALFRKLLSGCSKSSFSGSPEGGGVLDNSRGNTGGICTPNALVASRKLLPVLIEVIGVKLSAIVLV